MSNISVVIPLYNKKPYIERAILSALRQTIENFELIVIDDGSTDGGDEVVKSIKDHRVKLVRQENQGASGARNRGIELARGRLIAFLDADDAWKPEYLEEIMVLHQLFPEAGAFATAYEFIDIDGSLGVPIFNFLPPGKIRGLFPFFCQGALAQEGMTASSVVVRKNVFEKLGGFKLGESKDEHRDMWLRIVLHYPVAWSNRSLVIIYSNTNDRQMIKRKRHYLREPAVSKTARQAIASGALTADQVVMLREYVAYYQIMAAHHCLRLGRKREALKILEYAEGTGWYKKKWRWYWTLLAKLPFNLFPKYEKIKKLESTFRKKYLKKIPISYETEKNGKKT